MKLRTKLMFVLILLLLASPLIFLKGCGKALNGGASGACPDSVAPDDSQISSPTGDLSAPVIGETDCYTPIVFKVIGPDVKPLNNVCVELTTNAAIALHNIGDTNCTNVALGPKTEIVTRTDDHGYVQVDLVTQATATGQVFFVDATSGGAFFHVKTDGAVSAP